MFIKNWFRVYDVQPVQNNIHHITTEFSIYKEMTKNFIGEGIFFCF